MATKAGGPGRLWLRRLAWGAGAVSVLVFAVDGGEYGTRDLLAQREERVQLEADLELLRARVAALRAELKSLRSDPAQLERLARERYGMVHGEKEILYWTGGAEGDSAEVDSAAADSAR